MVPTVSRDPRLEKRETWGTGAPSVSLCQQTGSRSILSVAQTWATRPISSSLACSHNLVKVESGRSVELKDG